VTWGNLAAEFLAFIPAGNFLRLSPLFACAQPPFLRAFNGSNRRISPFRHGAGCLEVAARIGESRGGVTMARVLNEILAYSCMAAFVTGIVVLAAATFIS
jgi:hypothetical protein